MTAIIASPHESVDEASARNGPRIPVALQQVFLASNRGKEVHSAPPEKAAAKTYLGNWTFQRKKSSGSHGGIISAVTRFSRSGRNDKNDTRRRKKKISQSGEEETVISTESSLAQQLPTLTSPTGLVVQMSPQGYLDSMLRSRGYCTRRFKATETAYYNRPTPLQIASHHKHLVDLMRADDATKLKELLCAGLSRNPCNQHGESLLHNICRRGDHNLLHTMIDAGTSLQVSDDYGRTPLHDACWSGSPNFITVDLVLQQDPRLVHITDSRGASPLAYVRNDNWTAWSKFLRSRLDVYWPVRNVHLEGEQGPPTLAEHGANTRPLPDPEDALPVPMAKLVAAGKMSPREARLLCEDDDDDESSSFDDSDYDSEEDYSEEDSDDEDDDSDDADDVEAAAVEVNNEEATVEDGEEGDDDDEEDEDYEDEEEHDEDDEEEEDDEDGEDFTTSETDDASVDMEALKPLAVQYLTGYSNTVERTPMVNDDSESCFDPDEVAALIQSIGAPGGKQLAW